LIKVIDVYTELEYIFARKIFIKIHFCINFYCVGFWCNEIAKNSQRTTGAKTLSAGPGV
jgi:hypothetical protein